MPGGMMSLLGPRFDEYGKELPWRGYPLAEVLPLLTRIAGNDFYDWTWCHNMRCKYVSIGLDTRDGGFVKLFDGDKKEISLETFLYQYKGEQPS